MTDEQNPRQARRRAFREDVFNLPNTLTMGRVVLIPAVLYYLTRGTPESAVISAWLYGASAVTDLLDGYLARKRNLVSVFGKFLDPLADKLLVMATLIYLVELDRIPTWIVVVLLGREISITALRSIASSEGVVIAAGEGGKWKTALQMVGILCMVLHFPRPVLPFSAMVVDLNLAGQWLIVLSMLFSLSSAVEYVRLFVDAVEAKEQREKS